MAKEKTSKSKNDKTKEISIHHPAMKKLAASKKLSMFKLADLIERNYVGFLQTLKRGTIDMRTLISCADVLEMDPRVLLWELLTDEEKERAISYSSDPKSEILSEEEFKKFLRTNAFGIRKLLDSLE